MCSIEDHYIDPPTINDDSSPCITIIQEILISWCRSGDFICWLLRAAIDYITIANTGK